MSFAIAALIGVLFYTVLFALLGWAFLATPLVMAHLEATVAA